MAEMEHTGNDIWVKPCTMCGVEFPVKAATWSDAWRLMSIHFTTRVGQDGYKDDLDSRCRSCHSSRSNNRVDNIHRDQLLIEQDSKCGICSKAISFQTRNAYVDHDHATGINRAILCPKCNTRMSAIDDNEWLEKAIAYRDSYRG